MKFIAYIVFLAFGFALAAAIPNEIRLINPNDSRSPTDCKAQCAVFGYNNGSGSHSACGGICTCTNPKTL
jgi:hypothetical protein